MICIEYSKTHEDLRVLMRYLVLLRCLTEYQNRLEFSLRQGGYDDVFISNLIIFYNKLHFVDIVAWWKNSYVEFLHWEPRHDHGIHNVHDTYLNSWGNTAEHVKSSLQNCWNRSNGCILP